MENLTNFKSDWMIRAVTNQNYIYEDTTRRVNSGEFQLRSIRNILSSWNKILTKTKLHVLFLRTSNTACRFSVNVNPTSHRRSRSEINKNVVA